MCEELAAVGVSLSDDEYTSTIIRSLPAHYANYIAHLSASAHLLEKTLKPDDTMRYLTQEYDCLNAGKAESSKGEKGVAFTASSNGSGNRGQKLKRKKGACWNCGGNSHKKDQCPSPSQDGKEKPSTSRKDSSKDSKTGKNQLSTSKGNSANAAEFEEDGAWAACAISSDEEADELFVEITDYESSDSEFWFSETEDDDTPHVAVTSENGATLVTIVAPLATKSVDEPGLAAAAGPGPRDPNRVIELYDSGTTHHPSPYRDRFVTFRPIPPKGFDAANQQSFSATGVGDMLVEVPNGAEASTIQLNEALYSPEVGYTLVSIGRIDDAGCTTTFGKGVCTISAPSGKVLGQIPKTTRGLYKVVHDVSNGSANVAAERLTTLELHRRMGHITPETAKRLVTKGFMTGLALTDSTDGSKMFCEPCVAAKSKRRPVAKERLGERATIYGGEVHSDLWGPAPIKSLGGRRYYISYTDNKTRETTLYLLREKSETFETYKRYKAWVRNHRCHAPNRFGTVNMEDNVNIKRS